jgi:hypothetical protein
MGALAEPVAHAQWVFDCDAPLDQFQQRMQQALKAKGWIERPTKHYDVAFARGGTRCYVRLVFTDQGVLVVAKVKPVLFASAEGPMRELWDAARQAQVESTPAAPTSPAAPPA